VPPWQLIGGLGISSKNSRGFPITDAGLVPTNFTDRVEPCRKTGPRIRLCSSTPSSQLEDIYGLKANCDQSVIQLSRFGK
jgi:hypothetical protein